MNNKNSKTEPSNPEYNKRNVDRTSGANVDRSKHLGVDRTRGANVDRTKNLSVDRTSGSNSERAKRSGVDRTQGRKAADYDYFPGLKVSTDETEITSNSGVEDIASHTGEYAEREAYEPQRAESIDDISSESGADEVNDISSYSNSSSVEQDYISAGMDMFDSEDSSDIYSYNEHDYSENISSSSPRDGYSEKPVDDKKVKLRRVLKKAGKIALSAFLVMTIVGCIVGVAFAVYVFGFVDDSIDFDLYDLTLNYTTTVYVQDTDYVPQSAADSPEKWIEYENLYYENRTWVSINDVSKNMVYAFVAGEDERFYKHSGIDWKRTIGAFANLIFDFWETQQGGSTITQQLVKNLTGDDEKSSMRKIREIMRARNLEATYAKDTIMECYMNVIYLSNNSYGVEAAAEYYFGKSASDLTVAESACIAAIAKSPSGYDPYKNPENNKTRREWIINNMHKIYKLYDGKIGITEEERDAALKEKLVFVDHSKKDDEQSDEKNNSGYSWFTDALIEQLIEDLMETKGYTYEYAENMVYRGGLKIYATLDTDVQASVDKVFTTDDNWAQVYGTKQKAQGAITVMDYSGHVVAISGGRGEKTGKRDLNRASSAARQPGSSMKPIGVYAPAIEDNLITWSSKISNAALTIGGFKYKNYDWSTSGPVTVQNALERSLNLPPLRILNDYGAKKSFDFVTQRFGITTLVESKVVNGKELSDIGLSQLALGGCTYGLTTLEEAAAFATFGNGGLYYKPTLYTVVKNQSKETVLEYEDEPIQAISEETSYIMNKLLQTVVTGSSGTGHAAAFDGWEIFAKTGTTSDNKDRWFVGGTPRYVASVWFGCDKPFDMSNLSKGGNPALNLWKPIMRDIHSGLSKTSFPSCSTVKYARYCLESGGLATSACTGGVGWGYYKNSYAPVCSTHKGGKPLTNDQEAPTTSTAPESQAPVSSAAPPAPESTAPTTSSAPESTAPTTSTATSTPESTAPAGE